MRATWPTINRSRCPGLFMWRERQRTATASEPGRLFRACGASTWAALSSDGRSWRHDGSNARQFAMGRLPGLPVEAFGHDRHLAPLLGGFDEDRETGVAAVPFEDRRLGSDEVDAVRFPS